MTPPKQSLPTPKQYNSNSSNDPLVLLSGLADRLAALSRDMEAVALAISEQLDERKEDVRKLDQLRSVLKGLA